VNRTGNPVRLVSSPGGRSVFERREVFFGYAADGTNPVIRQIFESDARLNASVRITEFRVVNITAHIANIFLHNQPHFG
jgi:hypothetical protein